MEGEVLFDIFDVGVGNECGATEEAFPLAVLALKQVAFSLFTAKDLPSTGDFESLCNGFSCFCFSSYSWHGAGNLGSLSCMASQKWVFLERMRVWVGF